MDAESDDSERWEDFYGSSTELAPALLSIYDALNTSLETKYTNHSNNNNNNNNKSNSSSNNNNKNNNSKINNKEGNSKIPNTFQNGHTHRDETHNPLKNDINLYNSPTSQRQSLQQSSPVNKSSCRSRQSEGNSNARHRNNIKLLSPNVQRIIAHSDAEHVETIDIEALQQHSMDDETSKIVCTSSPNQHYKKKSNSSTVSGHGHKSKLSLIPLSKGAEKLTMTGNELVPTFDSSTEYLDTLTFAQNQAKMSTYKHIPASDDDEKTPTNTTSKAFTFDITPSKDSNDEVNSNGSLQYIDLLEMKKLATTTQMLSTLSVSPVHSKVQDLCAVPGIQGNSESDLDKTFFGELIETQNGTEAVNTSLVNKSIIFNSNKMISRSQSLAHPRSTNKDLSLRPTTVTMKTTTSKSVSALEEHENGSTESLDRLTEMKSKFPPRGEPQKISSLLLPDMAKLKHRPLSSSSLCSTTSSSSSGSDNLNTKLSTSYLASVESLADHSESELTDQHTSMSVLDRSCLEIVDSERNYVEDLRQVITGYLSDWRERACLRIDELKVLFSNIEEIYDFSSMLLKQLMEASMDPVKIAKCFIELRESFTVYTKYCTSYPEAISLLTKLLQATHTNSLLTSTQKMLQHTLPLGSYLLKPVQRILKYHLLLDNLRKHCDFKEVFQAYEIMRQVARNIDQVKRRLEQQSRVKELSGILDGWLGPELTVLGELRLEGLLMDHNKPRMVFLFATMLIITKPKEDNRLQFKSYITQNNLMLSEHLPGEPTSFYVIPYDEPRNQIKLTAKNRDQKRVWTQHIKEAMLEKFDNIPSRAKELVYKLGDEEDRTSGKNTWKWTMNSTSMTPVYLERRNQYRRSELRNRFKLKRKSIADLSFTQSGSPKEQLPDDECNKPTKPLTRKNSLDDSMVPMLFRFATAVRHKCLQPTTTAYNETSQETESNSKESEKLCNTHVNNGEEPCSCIVTDQRSKTRTGSKLKERSKSVPRINIQAEDKETDNLSSNESHQNAIKSMEIKQYNHKTMPKRVATIKKQRNSSNKRDTFKFYMDISEFDGSDDTTILKITESSENLNKVKEKNLDIEVEINADVPMNVQMEMEMGVEVEVEMGQDALNLKSNDINVDQDGEKQNVKSETLKSKRDAQIVFDLLKDNKDFERIYRKAQKKRSSEMNANQRQTEDIESSDKPPPPPSTSPPLLELERGMEKSLKKRTQTQTQTQTQSQTKDNDINAEEHIYETLLRNVHVPYKFSPHFKRSKSLQYNTQREKNALPPRPESDYVVLQFSADGTLQGIESNTEVNDAEEQSETIENETPKLAINSQDSQQCSHNDDTSLGESKTLISSTISLEVAKERDTLYADQKPKGFVRRLFIARNGHSKISSLENISNAFLARNSRRKSTDNNTRYAGNSTRPPERRASDVSEMCRLAMLHRQGSEAVGERMAYLDYADPRTLFNLSAPLQQIQRDSFFSLTSSNDSVCKTAKNSSTELSTTFEYENDVEDNLERDFRDSAIYSDDNEKRIDFEVNKDTHTRAHKDTNTNTDAYKGTDTNTNKDKVKDKNKEFDQHANAIQSNIYRQQVPPKLPPKLPPKPPRLKTLATPHPAAIICPPHMNQTASRSWVLQQIENFSK